MGALFSLIGGIKGVVAIVLIVALGGWIWNTKSNLEQAEAQRDTAIAQRDLVAAERDKAIEVARINQGTVDFLKQDKQDINAALNTLAQQRAENAQNTVTREVIIQSQAALPANSAITAPVIGDIISEIQIDKLTRAR
jgi:hypothetical protein